MLCYCHPCHLSSKLLICAALSILCMNIHHDISAFTISTPSSARDYQELAKLLVDTFDSPPSSSDSEKNKSKKQSLQSKLDALRWITYERSLTYEYTYKQYTSTARKMRDKKYCLLVAKEYVPDGDKLHSEEVVGMVEMGISLCEHNDTKKVSDATKYSICLRPQPTLGMICVKSSHQEKGIGQALVDKCEQVAREMWDYQSMYVDVEPHNRNALSFFEKCGYDHLFNQSGERLTRDATVVRRRKAESRPHYLFRKRLKVTEIQ